MILNDEILGLFCVDKGCNVGFLFCNDRLHLFHTQRFQICCDGFTGTGRDLVDHRPGESNRVFIGNIGKEAFIHKTGFLPFLCHRQHRLPENGTVLGTVVHGYQCQRVFSGLIPGIEHGSEHCHGAAGHVRTVLDICLYKGEIGTIGLVEGITLFCNGEGHQLEGWTCEDLFQPCPVCRIRSLCLDGFGHGAQHLVLPAAIPVENNA